MTGSPEGLTRTCCAPVATCGEVALSPYDLANMGRSTPMTWFYEATLDPEALIAALEQTLAFYPVFCGRYNQTPPSAIALSNAGVPVQTCTTEEVTLAAAIAHLPNATPSAEASIFSRSAHEPFVPAKAPMDPDAGSPDVPLLALKITTFALGGGTAIGMLLQHGVADADAQIAFMRNWSRIFRGLALDPSPIHDRGLGLPPSPPSGAPLLARPDRFNMLLVPPGEPAVPPFMAVMPKIAGPQVCVVPLTKAALAAQKAAASAGLAEGAFVSTDDVACARVWQALCTMRCAQLGLGVDCEEVSTCSRACNFRRRTEPPLGEGYCGNELRMSASHVAQRLRADLQACTPEAVTARGAWLREQQRLGNKTTQAFDANALTFIVSSWGFDWEGANFGAKPARFD
eukprot:CAMPEP_0181344320 /NCGR_PEP_ID=MMETSP1101-20121128/32111_1 /TAXON_ID=46948 /ORGANISM="Rhodomonas abbreviata, Strain Caron Lab Isolate" /LENGTH=400 /DNA_ID=CAMNT_0023456117 /DNA_START=93 /DNA_END=1292 /DNA_ORIENTATION=+